MGSRKTHEGAEAVYAAAQKWVDCALRKDDSLFTQANMDARGSGAAGAVPGSAGRDPGWFLDKLRSSWKEPPEVYQLMGEVLYFHFLIIRDEG